jgi:hypothetical protein
MIRAELSQDSSRHPKAYALYARGDDPASRLAFRASISTASGEEVVHYPRSRGEKCVKKIYLL